MAKRNIEIKAKFKNQEFNINNCNFEGILNQKDTFFKSTNGRLKLREETSISKENKNYLVQYQRNDQKNAKLSTFYVADVRDPKNMIEILKRSNGIIGVIVKKRSLYIHTTYKLDEDLKIPIKTRIHIDDVNGLGEFIELEVMLDPSQTIKQGKEIVENLSFLLGISDEDLIDCAYFDLMNK